MGQIHNSPLGSPVAVVGPGGRLFVDSVISGNPMVSISGNIIIGSVSASVDDIYVTSGTVYVVSGNAWGGIGSTYLTNPSVVGSLSVQTVNGSVAIKEQVPTSSNVNNPYLSLIYVASGTTNGVTGSEIGSIIQYIGAGSYVKVLTYSGGNLTNVGSWS